MERNKFLVFCFAFVPGAGQMLHVELQLHPFPLLLGERSPVPVDELKEALLPLQEKLLFPLLCRFHFHLPFLK